MINAWSTAPATREAIEGSERFTTIDPERIEMYLAGECIPAEQASLELDVVDAKGEPLRARGDAIGVGCAPARRAASRE